MSSVDQETIAYAVFDIVAKCVFGLILVRGHAAVESEASGEFASPTASQA